MPSQSPYLMRAADVTARTQSFSHPWNSLSEIHGTMMGRLLGLKRTGVNFARVPPGKESFVYHSHQREEEWIYILSGEAQAEIDDSIFTVRGGDFMAFPTGVAHHLRNCGKDDLVYLCGGEHLNIEIADFPRLGKRMLRRGEQVDIVDIQPQRELTPFGA
ncbi:MAG: cupin domain-containing protein [Ralstonia sp.]|nr:cupin domain-containing protein [Ralstonia sp.]